MGSAIAFPIDLELGLPGTEQISFAVKKAVVAGQLRTGDSFRSFRVLRQELKINPNTARRLPALLVSEDVLFHETCQRQRRGGT
ncbi:MAG: hypothetical protein ABI222_04845 [Opitutaceae bacterium]